jgi:hypothetical protein
MSLRERRTLYVLPVLISYRPTSRRKNGASTFVYTVAVIVCVLTECVHTAEHSDRCRCRCVSFSNRLNSLKDLPTVARFFLNSY